MAKKIEIDESQYLEAQGVMGAVNGIMSNPEARKLLLQARKIADPSAVVPEIDAAAPVNAELKALREQLASTQKTFEEDKAAREAAARNREFAEGWDRQKQSLRASGYTDEGIKAIEQHAASKGIADLEIAAAHWDKLNPPPAPMESSGAFGAWNFLSPEQGDQGEYIKQLMETRGDNDAVADREAMKALREMRGANQSRR
jgi:hypothetical protein